MSIESSTAPGAMPLDNDRFSHPRTNSHTEAIGGGSPPRSYQFFELTTIVQAIGRRWKISVLFGALAAAGAAGVAWVSIAPQYVATSYVIVRAEADFVVEPQRDVPHLHYLNTQAHLATLPSVLRRALADPELKHLPESLGMTVGELRRRLSAEPIRTTEVMTISVTHPQARAAQQLANAVTRAYLEEASLLERRGIEQRLATLKESLAGYEKQMDEAYQKLETLAERLGSSDARILALRQQIDLESKRDYSNQLRQAQLDLRVALRRSAPDSADSRGAIDELEQEVEAIRGLLAEIDERLRQVSGADTVALDRAMREVSLTTEAANRVRRAITIWELEQHADQRVRLQNLADLPHRPQQQDRTAGALLAGAASATVALLAIAVWDFRRGSAAHA